MIYVAAIMDLEVGNWFGDGNSMMNMNMDKMIIIMEREILIIKNGDWRYNKYKSQRKIGDKRTKDKVVEMEKEWWSFDNQKRRRKVYFLFHYSIYFINNGCIFCFG